MTSYLFRNVQVWDGENDTPYSGEVVIHGNCIACRQYRISPKCP